MFSNDEEHLFASSSAFRWKERSMTTEISWQSLLKWLASYSSRGYVLFLMRVHSFSHRRTQKNRTHKGSQRHQVNRYHRTLQLILVERPLCSLYAEGVLCDRNVRQKGSVKSVRSVRKKTFTKYASSPIGVSRWLRPSLRGRGRGRGRYRSGLCGVCSSV